MCGRYVLEDEAEIAEVEAILREVNSKFYGENVKAGEIRPTNTAPILSVINSKPSLSLMSWGFPKWDAKGVIINARAETAAEKKMFSQALHQRRCVIPATGFYEWARIDGRTKEKFQFNCPENPMLYMAGVYSEYPKHTQEKYHSDRFVILTRAANEFISDLHERMPVILFKNELVRWLTDFEFAQKIMQRDSVEIVRKVAS